MPAPELGLGPSPKIEWIDINADSKPRGWHVYDFVSGEPIPVEEAALTGHIWKIEEYIRETTSHGDAPKLRVYLNCGRRNYGLVTGFTSNFGRGLLACLLTLNKSSIKKALTIAPNLGDQDKKVVFCSVYEAQSGFNIRYNDLPSEEQTRTAFEQVCGILGIEPKTVRYEEGVETSSYEGSGATQAQDANTAEKPASTTESEPKTVIPDAEKARLALISVLDDARGVYLLEGEKFAIAHDRVGELVKDWPGNHQVFASHAFTIMIKQGLKAAEAIDKAKEEAAQDKGEA